MYSIYFILVESHIPYKTMAECHIVSPHVQQLRVDLEKGISHETISAESSNHGCLVVELPAEVEGSYDITLKF